MRLKKDEKDKLTQSIKKDSLGTHTVVNKCYGNYDRGNNNLPLVEIDFTQPLDEVLAYVKLLYKEHEEGNIIDVFDYLGIRNKAKEKHKIYTTNKQKTFNILLADKLFIYDAKKIGFRNEDILDEINKHYEVLEKQGAKIRNITEKAIVKYSKEMIDFIDNDGFIDFKGG